MVDDLIVINKDNFILVETVKNKELYVWNYNFDKVIDMNIVYYLYKSYEIEKILKGEDVSFNEIIFTKEHDNRFIKITLHSFKRVLNK